MNAAEVAFLRAEAKLPSFNFNVGSKTAKEYYEEGVTLSFEQWGASGVSTYLSDNTSKPTAYSDPAGTNSYASTIVILSLLHGMMLLAKKQNKNVSLLKNGLQTGC